MGANKVEEENKHGDCGISRFKRIKSAFGLVPSFKAVVKGFDKVVANIILKAGLST